MATTNSWVTKKPDRQGGDACVRDTRVPVWVLAGYRRVGLSNPDILKAYPSLTSSDLEAAWAYVAANSEEIDQALRENEEGEAGLVE
jgi:uncharacterized protein (DUF433 family)